MMDIKLYESVLNSISDCIAIYKAVNDGEDFKFVEFNKAAEDLDKISKENLIGKNITEIFPMVKEMGLLEIFQNVYKTGKTSIHPLKFYEDDRISGYRENIVYKLDDDHIMAVYSAVIKKKQAEQELQKTLAFLKGHQDAMDASNIVTKSDLQGNITYANSNFYKVTGFSKEEVIGKPHNIVRHKDNPKSLYEKMWKTIQAKKIYKKIIKNKGHLEDYWVDLSIIPILDENNEIVEYIAVRHNITETIQQKEKLDNIANIDSLTGIGSRYKLLKDIESSISPAIAAINIDGFSQINDLFGHQIGDDVLKQFSDNLSNLCFKKYSSIYHLQGDEFVILDTNISKDAFLKKIADTQNNLNNINIVINAEDIILNFTTAISFKTKENILQTVAMALKIAKRENKSFIIYRDNISLNDEYANNIKWTKKIKKAINNNCIIPVFQPIVNNTTLEYEKYEALVRIQDEEKLISPFFFLDISKKTKQYFHITKIMIEKTFNTFMDKKKEFSINLTIEDILSDDIKSYIFLMLEKYDIGSYVVFEIVESELIEKFDIIISFIEKVKSYGCKIAIDDFGTGYSNFSYLMKLKADFIKIDGSMIKDIDTNIEAQIIVSTIVDFAKKLDIKTIAEYVENESIFKKVKELGIDYSQGYYFSKPKIEL